MRLAAPRRPIARMLRAFAAALASIVAPHAALGADPLLAGAELRYHISPHAWGDEERSLRIVLSFVGEPDGTTELALPDRWGGAAGLGRCIRNLRALTPGASVLPVPQRPNLLQVTHPPMRAVQIEYHVVQDEPSSPLTVLRLNRPVLRLGWFYAIGQALFVIPRWDQNAQRELSVTWSGLPAGWNLSGPWGEGAGEQRARGDIGDLRGATFIGGAGLRSSLRDEAGAAVTLITRGEWPFPDADLLDLAAHITGAQRRLLDDHTPMKATVIAIQTDEHPSNTGGEARTGGVSLYMPSGIVAAQDAAFLLAHEMFHLWNPRRIGRLAGPRLTWFSEGVTDWAAARTLDEIGLWGEGRFIVWINSVLRDYSLSSARALPVDQLLARRSESPEASRMPYLQGAILAHNWEADLRRISGGSLSFQNVLRRLVATRVASPLDEERIADAFPADMREGVLREIRRCIIGGGVIDPRPDAFAPRLVLTQEFLHAFDPGFEVDPSLVRGVITGVRPGSAAWRAGLRDGQLWVGGGVTRDPDEWAEIVIADDRGAQRIIRYLPRSGHTHRVPQYRLPSAR